MHRSSAIRACTTKRGDRHFDTTGGISGSFLHPKETRTKKAYMNKLEMTYWQNIHRMTNSIMSNLKNAANATTRFDEPVRVSG